MVCWSTVSSISRFPKISEIWDGFEHAEVEFVPSTYIGKDKTIDDLFEKDKFDVVFIGVGFEIDAKMEDVTGVNLPGVYEATEVLVHGNVDPSMLPPEMQEPIDVGRHVVIIGGGETASDCLRTALRMGPEKVTYLYRRTENEMFGGKKDCQLAKEEGAQYYLLTQLVKFIPGEDGKLAAVECIKIVLGEPDEKGRRRPILAENSNFSVACDTAILSLGYWPDPILGETTPNLQTHNKGLIKTVDFETGQTSREGIFSAGDCVTGPDLVVTAMRDGRKVANAIDEYLRRYHVCWTPQSMKMSYFQDSN